MPMFCRRSRLVMPERNLCVHLVYRDWSVRKVELSTRIAPRKPGQDKPVLYDVVCSWCGALIRSTSMELPEQICFICHARMLNDSFQLFRKKAADSSTTSAAFSLLA